MSRVSTIVEFESQTNKILEYLKSRIAPRRLERIQLSFLEGVKIDYFDSSSSVKSRVRTSKQSDDFYLLTPFLKNELKIVYEALIAVRLPWIISTQSESIRVVFLLPTGEVKLKTQEQIEKYIKEVRIRVRPLRHDLLQTRKNEFDVKSDQKQKEAIKKEELELLSLV